MRCPDTSPAAQQSLPRLDRRRYAFQNRKPLSSQATIADAPITLRPCPASTLLASRRPFRALSVAPTSWRFRLARASDGGRCSTPGSAMHSPSSSPFRPRWSWRCLPVRSRRWLPRRAARCGRSRPGFLGRWGAHDRALQLVTFVASRSAIALPARYMRRAKPPPRPAMPPRVDMRLPSGSRHRPRMGQNGSGFTGCSVDWLSRLSSTMAPVKIPSDVATALPANAALSRGPG